MPRTPDLRHVYANVAELNDTLTAGGSTLLATDTANNALKLEILGEVSRLIDSKAHRGSGFGPWVGTLRYDGNGSDTLWLRADVADLDTLIVTPSVGGTPETLVVDDDFFLAGLDGYEEPFRKIILHGAGARGVFPTGHRVSAATGTWTYPYRTRILTPTLGEDLDTSETEVDVSSLTGLSPGMVILIDTEQMYVYATTDSTTDSVSVERGVNGTTAAAHTTGAAITRYVYDPTVHTLALRLAQRRWKAREAGADGTDGGMDVGSISLREGEDTIIRRMLGPTLMLTGHV